MPPQAGLYAFVAGSLAYALIGKNRYVSVGADSTIAPIFAGSIAALAVTGHSYAQYVGAVALGAGVLLILAGILRAGWLADLLSIPVTVGFLAGISVHIVVGQLPLVLGIPAPEGTLLQRVVAIAEALPHAQAWPVALGAAVFLITFASSRLNARIPGALIGLAVASVLVGAFGLQTQVSVLGALPAALPAVAVPLLSVREAVRLVPISFIVAVVCMMQTALVVRSFPTSDAEENPSRSFGAVGLGSVVAASVGSFAVDASPPRTAVLRQAGAQSQVSGLAAVLAVVLLMAFGGGLGATIPLAALGGVLVYIGMHIFRLRDMVKIARRGGPEIWFLVASAMLVIALPIEQGMLASIALSLTLGIYLVARPPSTVLLRVRDTTVWWPPSEDEPTVATPGLLVFAPAAPITFTNAQFIAARLRTAIDQAQPAVKLLVIECGGVIYLDYTGAQVLARTIDALRQEGIVVALARLSDERARQAVTRTGLLDAVGPDHVFKSVYEAVVALGGSLNGGPRGG